MENIIKKIFSKLNIENLDQTYTVQLPKSGCTISVIYSKPFKGEEGVSVEVDGWITKINDPTKSRYKFRGILVKTFGTRFKDVSKDLTESMEKANELAGKPITDVYEFIEDRIGVSVPVNAIDEYFKGNKKPKVKKEKVVKPEEKEPVIDIPSETPTHMEKGTVVKIKLGTIQANKDIDTLQKLISTYPEIKQNPYAVVFDDGEDKTSIVFKNQKYIVIPRMYLQIYKQEENEIETNAREAYQYYEQNRKTHPQLFDIHSINSMIKYKNKMNIPIDDIDKNLLQERQKEQQSQEIQEKTKDNSWIKNIFKKKV